ncbi:MAG: class I SAM-dependent methyltransferase [Gammaproteobacteria bacterium]|nr:class I SAM-dependent methyltransferase [Gammaproteobacteria bacterium]
MSHETADRICPLCRTADGRPFYQDNREYFQCPVCCLVFVLPQQFLTLKEEKAIYDLHENSIDDPGYRGFLSRLFSPLLQCLAPGSHGLDFGAGPEPALAEMFQEAGHSMAIYDPFYAPESKTLQLCYDFISASEVVEHLHHPGRELERLWSCLKPNGTLGIMTKRVIDQKAFSRWHYKNDLTHVCFFSLETFQWLAEHWCATLTVPENDVVLFTRSK